jgi:hypothetical protein
MVPSRDEHEDRVDPRQVFLVFGGSILWGVKQYLREIPEGGMLVSPKLYPESSLSCVDSFLTQLG